MVASFTASNQIGEAMKKDNLKKKKGAPEKNTEKKDINANLDKEIGEGVQINHFFQPSLRLTVLLKEMTPSLLSTI